MRAKDGRLEEGHGRTLFARSRDLLDHNQFRESWNHSRVPGTLGPGPTSGSPGTTDRFRTGLHLCFCLHAELSLQCLSFPPDPRKQNDIPDVACAPSHIRNLSLTFFAPPRMTRFADEHIQRARCMQGANSKMAVHTPSCAPQATSLC